MWGCRKSTASRVRNTWLQILASPLVVKCLWASFLLYVGLFPHLQNSSNNIFFMRLKWVNVCEEPSTVLGINYVFSILYGCFYCYVLNVATPKFGSVIFLGDVFVFLPWVAIWCTAVFWQLNIIWMWNLKWIWSLLWRASSWHDSSTHTCW